MERIEPVYITHEEFLKLLKYEIGNGTDGTVCRYRYNQLIKVYHSKIHEILNDLNHFQDDVKIYKKGSIKEMEQPITAYFYNKENKEHLRLQNKEAIEFAISKQKNVSRTKLPQNMVYIDNLFAGCLLKRVYGIGVHSLMGLPLRYRGYIMLEVIKSVRELLENNIYPRDLGNSPYAKDATVTKEDGTIDYRGHSHVLVNPFTGKINIIDLDGNSAVYTDSYSEECEKRVFFGLCQLLIEFFLDIDATDMLDKDYERDTLAYYLENARVKREYIEALSYYNLNIDQVEDTVKSLIKSDTKKQHF